jgi:hypothetical protein
MSDVATLGNAPKTLTLGGKTVTIIPTSLRKIIGELGAQIQENYMSQALRTVKQLPEAERQSALKGLLAAMPTGTELDSQALDSINTFGGLFRIVKASLQNCNMSDAELETWLRQMPDEDMAMLMSVIMGAPASKETEAKKAQNQAQG